MDLRRRRMQALDVTTGSMEAGKGLTKSIGKSLFHTSVGIFCLYSEVTDTLSKLSSLYDPYHISRPRPIVTDIVSVDKAGGLVAWHDLKDGVQDLYKKPSKGAKVHGLFVRQYKEELLSLYPECDVISMNETIVSFMEMGQFHRVLRLGEIIPYHLLGSNVYHHD
ncbi:unnamed protein product [Didymodactylos carnosus]|uniref:Uncharacterized protein n=1 Tax=Didymodactylos carnosus TaxID=1234261 RepID=A0A8S2CTQ9_9BILA|nr:unnamed protein product [Didymodactylos carnosus]CAF3512970.1 unnamed protein product [Didymodactylos carnosus]